nr:hypothetical protein CFP56_03794 [Quercus suber]
MSRQQQTYPRDKYSGTFEVPRHSQSATARGGGRLRASVGSLVTSVAEVHERGSANDDCSGGGESTQPRSGRESGLGAPEYDWPSLVGH